MPAQPQAQERRRNELNATPLSQHVMKALRKAQTPIYKDRLVLVVLLLWATENHYLDPTKAQEDLYVVLPLEQKVPELVYEELADARLLEDNSLSEMSATLASAMSNWLDDRTLLTERWGNAAT